MELNDKVIREVSAIAVVVLFGVLVFFAVRPLLFAIMWGLIGAYVFMPLFRKLNVHIQNKTLVASITILIAILMIILPLWFVAPMIVQQVFEVFRLSQTVDMTSVIHTILPTSSQQFTAQLSATVNSMIAKATAAIMSSIVDYLKNIPLLLVNFFVICFVFFFALRDSERLKEFIKGISPLSKSKEKILIKNFKDVTYSIIYGNFIVGLVQGLFAGLGLFMFGVSNALVLTILCILFSIIPVLGSFIIWIPVAIYMFISGDVTMGVLFVLYNFIIVSNIDNVLRAYILSKRTNLSPVFALISSIGGLLLFGVIGLILGPLIFAYFIILMDMYREKNLLGLFAEDKIEVKEPVVKEEKAEVK